MIFMDSSEVINLKSQLAFAFSSCNSFAQRFTRLHGTIFLSHGVIYRLCGTVRCAMPPRKLKRSATWP
jgi:hypothetical protein